MIQKKICLVGAFSVGKTSLVKRFVESIYDDKYLTTVGVRIDKKTVSLPSGDVKLIIWDLAGKDDFTEIRTDYLRGTSVCVVVLDVTRQETLATATEMIEKIQNTVPDVEFIAALNKFDMEDEFQLSEALTQERLGVSVPLVCTSAKSGLGVEQLFENAARASLIDNNQNAA